MATLDFDKRFEKLTGHEPFIWQKRLFEECFVTGQIPSALDLPTGLGKTSVMVIWYLARLAGAPLPRRLVYVVDRRAVVDQATDEAENIKTRSDDANLRISTLRGQHADNRKWLEDPASPAIIVGTVDMIGSRLLFEGYGVSRRMRPYHAGLLGADTLVVLDESHLVPPFERLLRRIADTDDFRPTEKADRDLIPRFHLLPLSATGRNHDDKVFRLNGSDRDDEIVRARLGAEKRLTFAPVGKAKLEDRLAKEAWSLVENDAAPARVLVYCNTREVAEKTKKAIEKLAKPAKIAPENFQLLVGARRVKEREDAKTRLKDLGFFSEKDKLPPETSAFVIATSAGEVGVDLDADHMVMDLVPFERMVQRLGRVNRVGGTEREARIVAIEAPDEKLPDELKARAKKAAALLKVLPQAENTVFQAGPAALVELREKAGQQRIREATSPDPLYPALSRPLVDAWSMTSLQEHSGRPEVQPWLRGWVDDLPQTTLVWRTFLPVRQGGDRATDKEIAEFFAAAPPHLTEKLETESFRLRDWLNKRLKKLRKAAEREGTDDLPEGDTVVAFLLGKANENRRFFTLDGLIEAVENKKQFEQRITGMTLVMDACIGGLTEDGLLADAPKMPPAAAADGEDGWWNAEAKMPLVPFRVYRVATNNEGAESEAAPEQERDSKWRPIHAFDLERDSEGRPTERLVIDKWQGEDPNEDGRSVASRAQSLTEHQDWVGDRAGRLVEKLKLKSEIAAAVVCAAKLHDEGKRAERWQNAFHTPRNGRPYAKTGSRRPPNTTILGKYRHEFGSLAHVARNNEFGALREDLKDVVLHLVAAHHGRARPVIGTEGCDDGPPSLLEARARDVALRFARLQKRFGPWGLAWLEAILRAADQQASRDLDGENSSDG